MDKAYNILESSFQTQISFLQDIIKYNTELNTETEDKNAPFGKGLKECLDFLLNHGKKEGLTVKNIDNKIGYLEIGSGDLIGILGHLDVVSAGEHSSWIYPPYDAIIKDNKLYGRGTTDDKGPLIAAYFAMLALKNSGIPLKKRFRLIAGTDEETSFRCIKRYLETEEVPVFSFSPDANFPAVHGEKGLVVLTLKRNFYHQGFEEIKLQGITAGERVNMVPDTAVAYFSGNIARLKRQLEEIAGDDLEADFFEDHFLKVTAKGVATHAMHPEKGENALLKLFKYLSNEELDYGSWELMRWIRATYLLLNDNCSGKKLGISCSDDISGPLTINLAIARYRGEDLTIKFDIRYPVTLSPAKMEKKITKIVEQLNMLAQVSKHLHPLYIEKDNIYLKELLKAYRDNTQDQSEPICIGGRTYSAMLPNTVSFGGVFPKDEELAHQINEHIDLDKFKLMTKIYLDGLINLNNL